MKLHVRRAFSGEGGGAVRARRIGMGHEFHDHRPYTDGDDFRHIDWNLFGRHGDLYVKRFRQETDLEFLAILDRSASMSLGKPSKDIAARRLICALASCFASRAQPFEFRSAEVTLPSLCAPVHSDADLEAAMDALEKLPPAAGRMSLNLAQTPSNKARNRVVLFVGDFLDAPSSIAQLAALKTDHCEVICVLICAEEERAPRVLGPVHLKDVEGHSTLRLNVDQDLLDRYIQAFDNHLSECQRHAAGAGLEIAIINAECPLDEAVLAVARRGALVR